MKQTRTELIRELIDSGCNKSFSELDEKSDTYLSDYKACLNAKKKDKSELINEYLNINNPDKLYDAESIQRLDNFNIMRNILIEQAFEQSRNKIEKDNNFINSIDMTREDSSGSFVADLAKYSQLKEQLADIANDDEKVNAENSAILYENSLRADIGLPEKPLLLTKNQLFVALSLDDFVIGDTCNELLDQYRENPFLFNQYSEQLKNMNSTYNLIQLSAEREKETISNIQSRYAILSNNVPEKLIKLENGRFEISQEFQNWRKQVEKFLGKITNMIRAEQSKENAISDYKVDKRGSLFKIRENLVKLLKDNI